MEKQKEVRVANAVEALVNSLDSRKNGISLLDRYKLLAEAQLQIASLLLLYESRGDELPEGAVIPKDVLLFLADVGDVYKMLEPFDDMARE